MKLEDKQFLRILWMAAVFVAIVVLVSFLPEPWSFIVGIPLFAALVLVGVAFQDVGMDCPHCGKPATVTPDGWPTREIGEKCRYCKKNY